MKKHLIYIAILVFASALISCKKCVTCTAHDSITNEIKFNEKSCSKGPLLDDWIKLVKDSYPAPTYNTTCE